METQYKVWLVDANFDRYCLFESINSDNLETWLQNNCEFVDGMNWCIDWNHPELIKRNIPVRDTGYIVKYAAINPVKEYTFVVKMGLYQDDAVEIKVRACDKLDAIGKVKRLLHFQIDTAVTGLELVEPKEMT